MLKQWAFAVVSSLVYVGFIAYLVRSAPPRSSDRANFPPERYLPPAPPPAIEVEKADPAVADLPLIKDRPRQSPWAALLTPEDISMAVDALTDAIWFERQANRGEDAIPFTAANAANSVGFLAVADGLGGSGNQRIAEYGSVTGAKLASALVIDAFGEYVLDLICHILASGPRLKSRETIEFVRKFIGQWSIGDYFVKPPDIFERVIDGSKPVPALLAEDSIWTSHITGIVDGFDVEALRSTIDRRMSEFSQRATPEASLVRSKMTQKLPTTLSAVAYEEDRALPRTYKLLCIWAGDSRAYAISSGGLRRLTVGPGTPEGHLAEGKMDGCISERIPNKLNFAHHTVAGPALLFVCSDGVYELRKDEMTFGNYMLDLIESSESEREFSERLRRDFHQMAGDDCSIAFSFLGTSRFDDAKRDLSRRRAVVA